MSEDDWFLHGRIRKASCRGGVTPVNGSPNYDYSTMDFSKQLCDKNVGSEGCNRKGKQVDGLRFQSETDNARKERRGFPQLENR